MELTKKEKEREEKINSNEVLTTKIKNLEKRIEVLEDA